MPDHPENTASSIEASLVALRSQRSKHPIWTSALMTACREGTLTRDDFAFVFGQYQLYSSHFVRFLAAFVSNCEDVDGRAELIANLWEEAGEGGPGSRHSELFRGFLVDGLGCAPATTEYLPATRLFVREYLAACRDSAPEVAAAFLCMGTEAIVPELYAQFVQGLLAAGVEEQHLEFFRLHMACDDAHAETLERLMLRDHGVPGWDRRARDAMNWALDLRMQFFDALADAVQLRRLRRINAKIQRERPLSSARSHASVGADATTIYANADASAGIDFEVSRLGFDSEALDIRAVTIAPHRRNEQHHHPHESVLYVVRGEGRAIIGGRTYSLRPGDCVFVPRWSPHSTENTGSDPLVLFAVTDFRLTEALYLGDARSTTRLRPERASD